MTNTSVQSFSYSTCFGTSCLLQALPTHVGKVKDYTELFVVRAFVLVQMHVVSKVRGMNCVRVWTVTLLDRNTIGP
jgi:hypothetical protein